VTIPAWVHVIKSNGFAECQFLHSVSFENPAQVTWIDGFAHSGLRHLALPPSVSVIGSSGFNSCQYLQSLAIPERSSFRRVSGFRSTRLERIVVDGPIDSRSVLDSMISPNRQTFLEYREKDLSEMRRDFAMIRSNVYGGARPRISQKFSLANGINSEPRVRESSSQTLIPAPMTGDFAELSRVE
jgi:hypothetical protein